MIRDFFEEHTCKKCGYTFTGQTNEKLKFRRIKAIVQNSTIKYECECLKCHYTFIKTYEKQEVIA
ncbi:MAG: hypothetical protein M0Z64_07525 [Nitrospiraceae bacterium]|nr:hypothetical protein [Nitrospiraceae bacterium]